MTQQRDAGAEPRAPLTRERILRAALDVADAGGVASLTMRKIATHLEVEAMSLYHHVANKESILDGLVDLVFSEIDLPSVGGDWKSAMRRRATSARDVLKRHPWAIALLDSRVNLGPATLRHHNAVIGRLREAGFDIAMAAHAFSLLDSYLYGFVMQELSMPFDGKPAIEDMAGTYLQQVPVDAYPYLAEMFGHAMEADYSFESEFAFGLDLILEGLEGSRGKA